jgi:Uma2 family endonuclease
MSAAQCAAKSRHDGCGIFAYRHTVMEKELTSQLKVRITPEEYLRLERAAETRSEYLDGQMIPMPGASREHNLIVANLLLTLGNELFDRPFEIYPSEMRVKVNFTGLYTYPDVVVAASHPHFEDHHVDTLLDPILLIEVLSKSTESYDRGRKFSHYRAVESLLEYVLVTQSECRIEQYVRQADGKWLYAESTDPDGSIELSSIACRLPLTRVYHKVEFPNPT